MYETSSTLHQHPAETSESVLESCDLHPIEPVHVRLTSYTRHSSPSPLRLQEDPSLVLDPPLTNKSPPTLTDESPQTPSRRLRYRIPRSRLITSPQMVSSPTLLRLDNKGRLVPYLMRSQTRCSSPSPLTLMNIHQDARYLTRSRVRMWKQTKKQPCPVHGKIIRRHLPRHQSTPKLLQGRATSQHPPVKGRSRHELFPCDANTEAECAAKYVSTPEKMKIKGKKQRGKGFVTRIRTFASRLQSRFSKAVSQKQTVDVTDFSNVQQASDVQWVELNSRKKQNYFSGSTEELDSSLPVTCFRAKKVKVTKSNPAKAHIKRLMKVNQQRSLSTPARAKCLSTLQSYSKVPLFRAQDSSTASSSQQDSTGPAQNPSSTYSLWDQQSSASVPEQPSPVLPPGYPARQEEPKVPPIIIKKTAFTTTKPCLEMEKVPPIVIRTTNTVINPLMPCQESDQESSSLTDTSQAESRASLENSTGSISLDQQPAPHYVQPRPRDYRWISPIVQSKVERIIEKSTADPSQGLPVPSRMSPLGEIQTSLGTQATQQGSVTRVPQPAPDVSTPGHMKSVTSKPRVPDRSSSAISDNSTATSSTAARQKETATGGKTRPQTQPQQPSALPTSRPGTAASTGPQQGATNKPVQTSFVVVQHSNLSTKEEAANFLRYFHKYGQTRKQLRSLAAKSLSQQVIRPETQQIVFGYLIKKGLLTDADILIIKLYIRQKRKMQESNKQGASSAPTMMDSSSGPRSKSPSSHQSIPTQTRPATKSTQSAQTAPAQHKPVTQSAQTAPAQHKPVTQSAQTAPAQHKLVTQSAQPAPAQHKPVTQSAQTAHAQHKPLTQSAQTAPAQHKPVLASKLESTTTGTTPRSNASSLSAGIQPAQGVSTSRILSQHSSTEASHPKKVMTHMPSSYQNPQHTPTIQTTQSAQMPAPTVQQPWSLQPPTSAIDLSAPATQDPLPNQTTRIQGLAAATQQTAVSRQMSATTENTSTLSVLVPTSIQTPRLGEQMSTPSTPLLTAVPNHQAPVPSPSLAASSQQKSAKQQLSTAAQQPQQPAPQISAPNKPWSATEPQKSAPQQSATPLPSNNLTKQKSESLKATSVTLTSTTWRISAPILPLEKSSQKSEQRAAHVPQQRATSIPQQRATPVSQQMSASVSQKMSAPVSQQMSAPVFQQMSAPVSQQMSATVSQQMSATVSQQMSATVFQIGSTPVSQLGSTPISQQMATPVSQQRSAPVLQQKSAPVFQPRSPPVSQQIPAPVSQWTAPVHQTDAARMPPSTVFAGAQTMSPSTDMSMCQSSPSPPPLPDMFSPSTEQISHTAPRCQLQQRPAPFLSDTVTVPCQLWQPPATSTVAENPLRTNPPLQESLASGNKPAPVVGMVIPSILVHRTEHSLHDDIRDMDTLSASKSRKRLFPESHQSEDTNQVPAKKSRFSYRDLLAENRAWVRSSVKSQPKDCKQCDGINEILHDTPHNLDRIWTVRPTERSPEKNWPSVFSSLCDYAAGKPHLLAKEMVWRLFTVEQLYGNRFHSLDGVVTCKIQLIVMCQTGCDLDHWQRKCVPFINASIRRLFNDKLRKYEHLLNHTCAPKETTPTASNTCTDVVPFRI